MLVRIKEVGNGNGSSIGVSERNRSQQISIRGRLTIVEYYTALKTNKQYGYLSTHMSLGECF